MKYVLLPCPFCGSRNIEVETVAGCMNCGCVGPSPTTTGDERESVALWNQRLDSEREPEE
jgi:uncharacterized Zn finger protein